MLPEDASMDAAQMQRLTDMVNRVYAASEKGLWKNGAARTTVAEMQTFAENGELAAARFNGKIIGCIRIRQLDENIGEFGLLAVDLDFQGAGIGSRLIQFAEQKCQKEHLRKMQLELLVPKKGAHPAKSVLENWYTRLGYRPIETKAVEALFPALAPMLAVPCRFVIFQKDLEAAGRELNRN